MSTEIELLNLKISTATELTEALVDSINNLSVLQLDKDAPAAFATASNAVAKASSINYPNGIINGLINKGMAAVKQRQYNEAGEYYEEALDIIEKASNPALAAEVRKKMGNVKYYQGQYAAALENYNRAIEMRSMLGDEPGMADLYTNSGAIHGILGNYAQALKSHVQALRIFERYNNQQRIATSCSNIGLVYTDQQNYDEALKMFERALAIRQNSKDLAAVSVELNNIGNVYQDQHNYNKAIEVYHKALDLREQLHDKGLIASSCVNLGSVYRHLKEYELALGYNERALELFTSLNDKRGLVQTYNNLGELYFEQKDYGKSYEYLNKAVIAAGETGIKNLLRKAHEYLAMLFAEQGKFEDAYRHHITYTRIDKEISNAEVSGQIAQTTLRYEIEQKQREAEMERLRNAELTKAYNQLEEEKKRSEELLLNILPEEVSEELKVSGKTKARSYEDCTVMFADIKGFTLLSEKLSAEELVTGIDEYFEMFDRIVEKHGIEKIKTIGDAYLCVGGVPVPQADHAIKVVAVAKEFLQASEELKERREAERKITFDFRIGIHTGPLVAGVVGIKKFAYDIWGDTVNTASRMQQHSEPNRINISESTYNLIKDNMLCAYRGEIEAKNKGWLKMYFVE